MPGSKVSEQSKKSNATQSSKYKGKKTEVDEGLFGNQSKGKSQTATIQIQNTKDFEKVQKQVIQGDYSHPDVIVLPESELQRMKNAAVIRTKDEQLQQKKILEEQKEKQQAAAKAKKEKMLRLEEEKKKQVPLNDIQLEEKEAKESMQTRAQEILNEELDEVKDMNKMMMYAKCVTVRDKQLLEKKSLHEQKKSEEKRKDLMMEIERLKKIKFYEEEEKRKQEELKKGHAVIIDQIQERELKRLREKEEQEMEGQLILKEIAALSKEESENAIRNKIQQNKQLDQILDANADAILIKQKKIQMELEEEAKIVKYNQEKALKEAEYLAEQKRIKDEKEREIQRLRELQEKAYDRQAELDALRAKRAMEQNERAAREREQKEAEIRKKINEDLQDARQLQALEKEKRLQEQAKLERDEFQRIIQVQKQERDIELKLGKEKQDLIKKHADELRKQIAMTEEKEKQMDKNRLEEGKKIKDQQQKYKHLVEGIKEKKLSEMQNIGIQPKYQAELARFKVQ